jgi:hypothetical protein
MRSTCSSTVLSRSVGMRWAAPDDAADMGEP